MRIQPGMINDITKSPYQKTKEELEQEQSDKIINTSNLLGLPFGENTPPELNVPYPLGQSPEDQAQQVNVPLERGADPSLITENIPSPQEAPNQGTGGRGSPMDILERYKQMIAAREESITSGREADANTKLMNQLNKSFSQIGSSIANRSGQIKVNEMTPLQLEALAEQRATGDSKRSIEDLMTQYKMIQDKEARELAAKKVQEDKSYKDRMLELEEKKVDAAITKAGKSEDWREKEKFKTELKDKASIAKENRKVRQDIEKALPNLETNLKNIDEAIRLLKTGKVSTGPVDGRLPTLKKESQAFNNIINNISLNKMVGMFQGMSKAVDSEGERAMFQTTVPSMLSYEDENMRQLQALKKATESMINKSKQASQKFDRYGYFNEGEGEDGSRQEQPQTSQAPYGQEVERNGKMYVWNPAAGKYQLK